MRENGRGKEQVNTDVNVVAALPSYVLSRLNEGCTT